MDSRVFLSLSLCFLFLLPDLPHSAIRFPRWLGDKKTQGSVIRLPTGPSNSPVDPTRVTQLSWRPRAFIYRKFLTDEECDHLIILAKDKLEKSMVADNESGKSIASEVRTSCGMFLRKAQIVERCLRRCFGLSIWCGELCHLIRSIKVLSKNNGSYLHIVRKEEIVESSN
ncbi:probable prolyl 4-hydroxylase 7 [Cornus florida]|uniref:probable prolyl 4-hydroxylase 7 n=1 Tax=Cornus florida TaxID=4283 RepID=UPI002896A45F|nr:probable prolyl 4-hydroxylase 7 [Cornus florida]